MKFNKTDKAFRDQGKSLTNPRDKASWEIERRKRNAGRAATAKIKGFAVYNKMSGERLKAIESGKDKGPKPPTKAQLLAAKAAYDKAYANAAEGHRQKAGRIAYAKALA